MAGDVRYGFATPATPAGQVVLIVAPGQIMSLAARAGGDFD